MATPFEQQQHVQGFEIGEINVNVEKLETDEDYDEIAKRVGERIYEEMMRGTPVGGLRLR